MHSDSEMDEDLVMGESAAVPTSPLPKSLSELSLSASSEQNAQEAYDIAVADYTIYNLIRVFATATRALAVYDCKGCLEELEKLPPGEAAVSEQVAVQEEKLSTVDRTRLMTWEDMEKLRSEIYLQLK